MNSVNSMKLSSTPYLPRHHHVFELEGLFIPRRHVVLGAAAEEAFKGDTLNERVLSLPERHVVELPRASVDRHAGHAVGFADIIEFHVEFHLVPLASLDVEARVAVVAGPEVEASTRAPRGDRGAGEGPLGVFTRLKAAMRTVYVRLDERLGFFAVGAVNLPSWPKRALSEVVHLARAVAVAAGAEVDTGKLS